MRLFFFVVTLATMLVVGARPFASQASDDACRPYFGNACSDAVGNWLPRFAAIGFRGASGAPTRVVDEIVDPAGRGKLAFLWLRGVVGGTFFVYGSAGPPRAHVVYDPVHRIAYYDEGCCSWHHVVLASNVNPPPKPTASRSLVDLRTARGIGLGDDASRILATYGPAPFHWEVGAPGEQFLRYHRVLFNPGSSPCDAITTFLFDRGRLTAMDFEQAC
jgi:hypothetical protein